MIDPNKEYALDVDGIYWNLSINGKNIEFDRKISITSIDIDETCKGSDSMTLKIADPDMEFLQDDIYLEDVPISLDMNFHGSTKQIHFYGYISTIDIDFPSDGSPVLELYCLDKTHLMQRVKNTQTWDNVRSVDVVREKCEGYGFNLVYQEDYEYPEQESISQSDQTDIEFLEKLAGDEREIFVAKLIGDTFFYVKLGLLAEPTHQLYYRYDAKRNNVMSFSPSIDKETKKVEEQYADINTSNKDVESFYANQATVALETQGYPIQVSSVEYGSSPYDDSDSQNDKNSDSSESERKYRDLEYNTLRGDIKLKPTAELIDMHYMETLNFLGIGKYLSGLYFIEGIKRTFNGSDGYAQSATLIKTGFGKTIKPIEYNDEVEDSPEEGSYSVGDTIKFNADSAVYAHASEGVNIPNWVLSDTWSVSQVDNDGRCVLLGDIESWVHMSDIEKA